MKLNPTYKHYVNYLTFGFLELTLHSFCYKGFPLRPST